MLCVSNGNGRLGARTFCVGGGGGRGGGKHVLINQYIQRHEIS